MPAMIAACPGCEARYRIDPARLGPGGARLRCTRCQAVFRVSPPREAPAPRPAPPAAAPEPPPRAPSPPPPSPAPTPGERRARLVLVADPDPERGKATASALQDWGLEALLVHDGVEAILTLQRALPRVAVLDAALPRMVGSEICELVKRNESLRTTGVVLVGGGPRRDSGAANEGYGPDVGVGRPDLPGALRGALEGLGLSVRVPPPAAPAVPGARPDPRPEPPTAEHTVPDLRPERAAPAAAFPPEEVQKAERLARIIVSDIVLYNEEKFAAAAAAGNAVEAMAGELAEGRQLFGQRIAGPVREARDFLAEELLRVAKSRAGS